MQYTPVQVSRYLREQRLSGLAVTEYCRQNNVNVWTFRGWQKRYGARPAGARMPFIRLDVAPPQVVEVVTGCRSTVRIPRAVDREELRHVLTAVKRSRLA
jgi:hypothetical protein